MLKKLNKQSHSRKLILTVQYTIYITRYTEMKERSYVHMYKTMYNVVLYAALCICVYKCACLCVYLRVCVCVYKYLFCVWGRLQLWHETEEMLSGKQLYVLHDKHENVVNLLTAVFQLYKHQVAALLYTIIKQTNLDTSLLNILIWILHYYTNEFWYLTVLLIKARYKPIPPSFASY